MKYLLGYLFVLLILSFFPSCRGIDCDNDLSYAKNVEVNMTKNNANVNAISVRFLSPEITFYPPLTLNDIPISFLSDSISLELDEGSKIDTLVIGYKRQLVETKCGWRMKISEHRILNSTIDTSYKITIWPKYSSL